MAHKTLKSAWRDYEPIIAKLGTKAISPPRTAPHIARQIILHRDDRLCVAFAPFNSPRTLARQMSTARVLFVGLTPGRYQACRAIEAFLQPSKDNTVSFAGPMRANLVRMLDEVGLNRCLNIKSVCELFESEASKLACSTSLLRFPVFVGQEQKNFSGSAKAIENHSYLRQMVEELFLPTLRGLDHACLVIPMGKSVAHFCNAMDAESPHISVLRGLPHPSGGNGHRTRIWTQNKKDIARQIRAFRAKLRGELSAD